MWDRQSAHADFRAFGRDKGGNWGRGRWERIVRRNRLNPLHCAARIIAVKSESTLYVELSVEPGTENETRFGAGQELAGRAGIEVRKVDHGSARQLGGDIRGSQVGDVIDCFVATESHDRAEFFRDRKSV